MSKAFEQALDAARESLPTMSQGFMSTQSCYEARELHMFRAGRALGRREVKGEARLIAISASRAAESIGQMEQYNMASRDRMFARSREARSIAAAIEAIPEEV